jgi:microsomal dipeptidase-like Zn-dependent dipeptidase
MIDALEYSDWDREIFQEMASGGLTCVHATVAVWEDARTTLDLIGRWNRRFRANADLIRPIRQGADIQRASADRKVGIVLGFQNTSPFEDDLDLVEIFHGLGIRIAQLTYNIQNFVGGSCYESNDSGLSRFGRYVIGEMNRVGMLVDLSHVGERTAFDAVSASTRPVAITHANLASVRAHPRNKSDKLVRALAEAGGVLGCSPYPHITGGSDTKLSDWCEMVARAVELMGVDHVAVGTDTSRKWTDDYLGWIRMGRWSHEIDYGASTTRSTGWEPWPDFYQTPADFPHLAQGLREHGFADDETAKIMGLNWLRLFTDSFGPVPEGQLATHATAD